jgi:hypothetical protein
MPSIQLEGIRAATTDDGAATSGVGCFSNSQSHSPADPNPFRTDFMPRAFFAPLNQLRVCDALIFTEQSCRSGAGLKVGYKYGALTEPLS